VKTGFKQGLHVDTFADYRKWPPLTILQHLF